MFSENIQIIQGDIYNQRTVLLSGHSLSGFTVRYFFFEKKVGDFTPLKMFCSLVYMLAESGLGNHNERSDKHDNRKNYHDRNDLHKTRCD